MNRGSPASITSLSKLPPVALTSRNPKRSQQFRLGAGLCIIPFVPTLFYMPSIFSIVAMTVSVAVIMAFMNLYLYRTTHFDHPIQLAIPLLTVEVLFGPFAILVLGLYQPEWLRLLPDPESYIERAMLFAAAGLSAMVAGSIFAEYFANSNRQRRAFQQQAKPLSSFPRSLVIFFALIALSGTAIRAYLVGGVGNLMAKHVMEGRRVVFEGTGYIDILSMFGTVATIVQAYRYFVMPKRSRLELVILVLITFATALPFFLNGHRGGTLYPIAYIFLVRAALPKFSGTWLRFAPLFTVFLLFMDPITNHIRIALVTDTVEEIGWFPSTDKYVFPRTYAHIELLGLVIYAQDNSIEFPATLRSSVLNWLPRMFFPNKGLSTGPTLVHEFQPDWVNKYGEHVSSYTTGPFVELVFQGGFVGLLFGMFALGFLLTALARWYGKRPPNALSVTFFTYECYLWGWDCWIDDLGGVINKQVIFLFAFSILFILASASRRDIRDQIVSRIQPRSA